MGASTPPTIRVGIGGWTFPPWRGPFYPAGLAHRRELEYASRQVTAIEINGTYYGSQKPESFEKWRQETPDGFIFSVKAPRFAMNRKVLADAGETIERFFASGVMRLAEKLGPINWQFMATKKYDPEDFEAFLALLPQEVEGRGLRHVVEVRHESFLDAGFVALLRRYGIAAVVADKEVYPAIHDVTAPFVYVRLQSASEEEATGYAPTALDAWAQRAKIWADGGTPADLPLLAPADRPDASPREVFVYMINGFKPKAPAAARALIERLA